MSRSVKKGLNQEDDWGNQSESTQVMSSNIKRKDSNRYSSVNKSMDEKRLHKKSTRKYSENSKKRLLKKVNTYLTKAKNAK